VNAETGVMDAHDKFTAVTCAGGHPTEVVCASAKDDVFPPGSQNRQALVSRQRISVLHDTSSM